jgi:hypothetical protein
MVADRGYRSFTVDGGDGCAKMRAMRRATIAAILGAAATLTPFEQVAASPYGARPQKARTSEVPAITEAPTTSEGAKSETPSPSSSPRSKPLDERRWTIRQAPLAGAEPSWGPPGQVPEYAELAGPDPETKGPPSRGTARIVTGGILGPLGLALAISGIVGASTRMLGEHKNLSVPMIGAGLVSTAIGAALLADGVLRRKRFNRWQASQAKVALVPSAVPGRYAGATLVLRF